MHSPRRTLTALVATLALAALFAVPAFSAGQQPASAALKPASVGVLACKSNAYYSGRQLNFRTKISRQQFDVPQKLAVKVTVWRKLSEEKRFKRLKTVGDKGWNAASDINAGIYQHDVIIDPKAIETRAEYRAKASFRWSNASTGLTEARKTVTSKICKQKTKLPKLRLAWTRTVQVPGEPNVTHTFTISNSGASEAVFVNVIVNNDANQVGVGYGMVESIGPKQSETLNITAPACSTSANATLIQPPAYGRSGVFLNGAAFIDTCK